MQAALSPAVRYSAVGCLDVRLFGCSGVPAARLLDVPQLEMSPAADQAFPDRQGCFATPAADSPANANQAATEGPLSASIVRRAPYRAPAGAPTKGRQQPLPSKPRQVRVRAPAKRK